MIAFPRCFSPPKRFDIPIKISQSTPATTKRQNLSDHCNPSIFFASIYPHILSLAYIFKLQYVCTVTFSKLVSSTILLHFCKSPPHSTSTLPTHIHFYQIRSNHPTNQVYRRPPDRNMSPLPPTKPSRGPNLLSMPSERANRLLPMGPNEEYSCSGVAMFGMCAEI